MKQSGSASTALGKKLFLRWFFCAFMTLNLNLREGRVSKKQWPGGCGVSPDVFSSLQATSTRLARGTLVIVCFNDRLQVFSLLSGAAGEPHSEVVCQDTLDAHEDFLQESGLSEGSHEMQWRPFSNLCSNSSLCITRLL